jgi:2-phosphosulfolactate phosphatase
LGRKHRRRWPTRRSDLRRMFSHASHPSRPGTPAQTSARSMEEDPRVNNTEEATHGRKHGGIVEWKRCVCYHSRMPRIDIALTAGSVETRDVRGKLCVVIDNLRAGTTIVAALAAGCPAVIPAETPEEARKIARMRHCLLGGERNSVIIEGFDFGNSPLEYTPDRIGGRPIAFTTTNGTRAMRACTSADSLAIASFVNAGAAARFLCEGKNDILIVCSGTRGEPSIEDTVCAGMLTDLLGGAETDAAREAVTLWNRHKGDLAGMMKRVSPHGRSLVDLGLEKDIDFAATLNKFDIVPILKGEEIVRNEP